LYKVLGKCFIGYIYRNIVQYMVHSQYTNTIQYVEAHWYMHFEWVFHFSRCLGRHCQSLVEADRTDVQVAWPLWFRRARL